MPIKVKIISFFVFILLFVIVADISFVFAQDDNAEKDEVPASERYIRDKYLEYYETDFDIVFNAVKQFIKETGAEIERDISADNDLGYKKGMCRSKILVLTQKTDSTFKIIQKYAYKPPFIRGGVWTSVRIQYKILLNDEGNGKISVLFENEFSGFEDHATFKVHFFKTNGLLEYEGFEKIKTLIEINK